MSVGINSEPISLIHNVFKRSEQPICEIKTAAAEFIIVTFFLKNNPKIRPLMISVSVNPGKYDPVGNRVDPIMSAAPPIIIVCPTPSFIAQSVSGINDRLILVIGV